MEEMNSVMDWPLNFSHDTGLLQSGTGRSPVRPSDTITVDSGTKTVAGAIATALANGGIRHVFGPAESDPHSFSQILECHAPHYNLNYYGIHHEGAAAFACSAYGKLTKRPAACLSNTRQGASSLKAGLCDAMIDHAPVLALIETYHQYQIAEALDIGGSEKRGSENVSHWVGSLTYESDPAARVAMACRSTLINSGVSQLRFSRQMLQRQCRQTAPCNKMEVQLPSFKIEPPQDALRAAADLLRESARIVVVVGQGARNRMDDVMMLAEQLRAAVVTTFKAKGLISERHPLAGGVLGKYGTPVAEKLLVSADAVLVFGANFSGQCDMVSDKPVIQIDHDLQALAQCEGVDVPIWGETGVTARAFCIEFLGDVWTVDQTADIARYWKAWNKNKLEDISQPSSKQSSARQFAELNEWVDDDAIIVIDAGERMHGFGRYFECSEHTVIMPAQADTIGFAVPAAMGAWVATQEDDEQLQGRQVVAVCDTQGYVGYEAELEAAARYGMRISLVILDEGGWHLKRIG
ncbi:MAG: hypothetical protein CSB47_09435 [Proteobacteria bacterium]|nr:MAG: hypothetical protein CSB47_09435 [Pseudomonadota bacterium]